MKEQKTFGTKTLFISVFIASTLAFFAGSQSIGVLPWNAGSPQATGRYEDANLQPFFKAWKLLDENFASGTTTIPVGTNEDRVWGAIQGLASSYGDPYTTFFPPKEKKIFDSQVQGDFEGVGMEIGIKNGFLTVISPLKGSPAEGAGIQSGDVVLKIDGKDTTGISVEDAVSVIRGKGGTVVTLLIGREGSVPFDVEITRATIALPTIETTNRPDGVFVIRLFTFNANASDKFRGAIREFANSGSDKLIIDLRGNPGGYLEVAVDIASWFLPVGKIIVTEDYGTKRAPDVSRSRGYDVFNDSLKLAILIDQGSASASEILSGALRDHGKATLVGAKSFGKGSVQQLFNVTPDTSLKITIARWLTPNGLSISHEGITPDIEVEMTKEDREAEKDPQLERAAEFLLQGK
ncbi:S41 family peptidase [Patescibacteria group bacterium]|nr:MAG: S41 family peptidase [Patescibacteria group bacterium]